MNRSLLADRVKDEVTNKEGSTNESGEKTFNRNQASSSGESNHYVNASKSIRFKLLVLDLILS